MQTLTNIHPHQPSEPADRDGPVQQLVHIAPWVDPVVDRRGHDPRSSYVETSGNTPKFDSLVIARGGVR